MKRQRLWRILLRQNLQRAEEFQRRAGPAMHQQNRHRVLFPREEGEEMNIELIARRRFSLTLRIPNTNGEVRKSIYPVLALPPVVLPALPVFFGLGEPGAGDSEGGEVFDVRG